MSRNIAFSVLILFCAIGCGHDAPLIDEPTAQLQIGLCLAPGALEQTNITRIELAVSTPDTDEPQLFLITSINQEERTASGLIRVPTSKSATFSARAFEGRCAVLSGLLENVEIASDGSAPIVITLAPIQAVVGIRSAQAQLSVGSRYELEVYVEDAPELFAFTCELEFNESLLEPLEIIPGDFFGDNVLFIQDSELPRREENRLAIGITLKGDAVGVCGSGVVFRVSFNARAAGVAAVTLLENITLINPDHEQIEDSTQIHLEPNSSVEIDQ